MKYYIIPKEKDYAIIKVSNELIESFEKEQQENVIARGHSIMEALLEFEKLNNKKQDIELSERPVKYKERDQNS